MNVIASCSVNLSIHTAQYSKTIPQCPCHQGCSKPYDKASNYSFKPLHLLRHITAKRGCLLVICFVLFLPRCYQRH